jgi:hypothetical protein
MCVATFIAKIRYPDSASKALLFKDEAEQGMMSFHHSLVQYSRFSKATSFQIAQ